MVEKNKSPVIYNHFYKKTNHVWPIMKYYTHAEPYWNFWAKTLKKSPKNVIFSLLKKLFLNDFFSSNSHGLSYEIDTGNIFKQKWPHSLPWNSLRYVHLQRHLLLEANLFFMEEKQEMLRISLFIMRKV